MRLEPSSQANGGAHKHELLLVCGSSIRYAESMRAARRQGVALSPRASALRGRGPRPAPRRGGGVHLSAEREASHCLRAGRRCRGSAPSVRRRLAAQVGSHGELSRSSSRRVAPQTRPSHSSPCSGDGCSYESAAPAAGRRETDSIQRAPPFELRLGRTGLDSCLRAGGGQKRVAFHYPGRAGSLRAFAARGRGWQGAARQPSSRPG